MMPSQNFLQRLTHVAEKRPSVGNLKRLWGSTGGAIGKGGATVAANQFHGRMGLKPYRKGLRGRIGQQIDRAPMLQIYKQRPVALTFAPSPLVSSHNTYMSRGGEWTLAHQAQDRRTATLHGQSLAQTCSSLTSHCLSDDTQEILYGKCPLSMGSNKMRKWFCKCFSLA